MISKLEHYNNPATFGSKRVSIKIIDGLILITREVKISSMDWSNVITIIWTVYRAKLKIQKHSMNGFVLHIVEVSQTCITIDSVTVFTSIIKW